MAIRRRLGKNVLTKRALTFEGIPEIVANANRLMRESGYGGRDIAVELKKGFMVGALIVRDEIRSLVPVRTGLLKSAIFAAYGAADKSDVLVGVNSRKAVKTTKGGKTRSYAGIVEFGNAAHPPQPYMRPGINAARPSAARAMKEALVVAYEKLAGRLGLT